MIKSVLKAMSILRLLSNYPYEGISLKDISEKTGIEKSTCSHIISTLCSEGYITRIQTPISYQLGPSAYLLTRYGRYNEPLIAVCHPVLRWLSGKTGESVILAVLKNNEKYIIDRIDLNNRIYNHSAKIFADDIYRTATGRIMLSYMNVDEIYEMYKKYGLPAQTEWEDIDSFDTLCIELEHIKRMPYVKTIYQKNSNTYNVGYAKSILQDSKCLGTIGIVHTVDNYAEANETHADIVKFLIKASEEINRRINFTDKNLF